MKGQKIQIEWELFLSIISLLKMIGDTVYKSNDNALIVIYNDVWNRIDEKLTAMNARKKYQQYKEAKNNGDKESEYKYLKEYKKIKNS